MNRFYFLVKAFVIAVIFLQTLFVYAQEPDPIKTGKGLFKSGYKSGLNIDVGVGYQNFLFMEGKASFNDKMNFSFNTFEYYAGSSGIIQSETGNYIYTGLRLGKRFHTNTPEFADSVSIINNTSIEYYFVGVTALFSKMNFIAKHTYWSWSPGVYFDFILGNMGDEIKNGKLATDLVTITYANEPQNMRSVDIGAALNFEFGFRAAFVGLSLRTGLRNLAPKDTDMTIRNTGMINFYLGYRFESDIAKQDKQIINSIIPR